MLPLLLLSACGGGETKRLQAPMAFRAELLNADCCAFHADLRVDVHGRLYEISADCRCDSDGASEITLTAPETVAGVKARVDGKTGRLEFDGTAVDFGLPADEDTAPVLLPGLLAKFWREGYILAAGEDEGLLQVSYEDDLHGSPIRAETWFDEQHVPVYAELSADGAVFAWLTLDGLVMDGGTQ